MAAPAQVPLDPFAGPWTEESFLDLPDDFRRAELLDGALLVSPHPGTPHMRLSARLWNLFEGARGDDLEALIEVNIRLGPERILIPDISVVAAGAGIDPDVVKWEARHVRMVVEIDGPNRRRFSERIKPALYAAAGIPHMLRIDLTDHGPDASAYDLRDGTWAETARARPGEELILTDPVPLSVDLAALLGAPRLAE
ncbi:Uma2 family endonuclease [Pseudonocardia nematodicida]|uniref:Uma2 family endonuclease n=1 Tax=Pseudonocardia nematodicida TaxID=1206997 RepID=A0ABV1KCW1_9PSEU